MPPPPDQALIKASQGRTQGSWPAPNHGTPPSANRATGNGDVKGWGRRGPGFAGQVGPDIRGDQGGDLRGAQAATGPLRDRVSNPDYISRMFGLSRHVIRDMSHYGLLPGIKKSSW